MRSHYPLPCRRPRCRVCWGRGKPEICEILRAANRYQMERREYRYRKYRRVLIRREIKNWIWRRDR